MFLPLIQKKKGTGQNLIYCFPTTPLSLNSSNAHLSSCSTYPFDHSNQISSVTLYAPMAPFFSLAHSSTYLLFCPFPIPTIGAQGRLRAVTGQRGRDGI